VQIKELIAEAISVSHYDTAIKSAIEQALANLFAGQWITMRLQLPTIMQSSQVDHLSFLADSELETELGNEFRKTLMRTLNPLLKRDYPQKDQPSFHQFIEWIYFQDMKENGHANGYMIGLTTRYLRAFIPVIRDELVRFTIDNGFAYEADPNDPELAPHQQGRSPGLYYHFDAESLLKFLGKHNRELANRIVDKLGGRSGPVAEMTDTIAHEVVHVIQHRAQSGKRKGTEYRSYLDTRKGEFRSLAGRRQKDHDWDDSQWTRLYYASPQEIGAHAHNMALSIVRDLGFDEPGADLSISLTAQDFVNALRRRIGDQYKDPNNPQERAVLKRYLKLAYQEVQRYLQQRRREQAEIRTSEV